MSYTGLFITVIQFLAKYNLMHSNK